MFNIQLRYLKPLLEKEKKKNDGLLMSTSALSLDKGSSSGKEVTLPFSDRGRLGYLISIDAMLEHCLMIQYLYSAYSIDTSYIPQSIQGTEKEDDYKKKQASWKEVILGVAKEEMGHFISVQNVLRCLGFPLNFGRQDFPWDSSLQPFPFELEKFSFQSIAKYIYAESPEGWFTKDDKDIDPEDLAARNFIKEMYAQSKDEIELGDPVGAIFAEILEMLNDDEVIKQLTFDQDTYPYQAKFDEWGRGYKDGQRGRSMLSQIDHDKFDKKTPNVLVEPIATRYEAIAALEKIAEQGEATDEDNQTPSHFERFLQIFKEMMIFSQDSGFSFAKEIVSNPQISEEIVDDPDLGNNVITNPKTQQWANLSDLRYHILLSFLTHSFLLEDGLNDPIKRTARGLIINSTFGEMYNIRTLSTILTGQPVKNNTDKLK